MSSSTPSESQQGQSDITPLFRQIDRLRTRLVDHAARRCAVHGWTTIALYGGGSHTRKHIRQPWLWQGVTVACVLDDHLPPGTIDGVPLIRPDQLDKFPIPIDAVVLSSEEQETQLHENARRHFGQTLPIVRIYDDDIPIHEPGSEGRERVIARLIAAGRSQEDAQWLADNRAERHDASVGSLPPARTELHLRRYLLAATFAPGARVLDVASGTGYGSALLADFGATHVTGLDIDADCIAYAERYHARDTVHFAVGDAVTTGLDDTSIDLITSFETIEHTRDPAAVLAEFARILKPGATLVISTPNDRGLTEFHEHSISQEELARLLEPRFNITHQLGQIPGNEPALDGFPPGIFDVEQFALEPETQIAIAQKR